VVSLAEFDFDLPRERIAQRPIRPRDAARLLCVRQAQPEPGRASLPSAGSYRVEDRNMRDLPDLLRPGDVLVANDTRVIRAQLTARRGAARIRITLNQPGASGTWHALARNARRLHEGDSLIFDGVDDFTAIVTALDRDGGLTLKFNKQGDAFAGALRWAGTPALPPYVQRPNGPESDDVADYQTVFAAKDGAVAAPTAGLHFTPALLAALDRRGVHRTTVTLHVGAGTFLPMRVNDVTQHRMYAERGEITPTAAQTINSARAAGGRIVAVGTTSLRLLEASVSNDGMVMPFEGETSLFIMPGYPFRAADLLMTNFHLPRSTLFMLVCAFAGTAMMQTAYAHGIETGYRFYSFGDSSLLWRHDS
jgi:S-adenosylmethionine:tRNA ribosyltransferase-isomerase